MAVVKDPVILVWPFVVPYEIASLRSRPKLQRLRRPGRTGTRLRLPATVEVPLALIPSPRKVTIVQRFARLTLPVEFVKRHSKLAMGLLLFGSQGESAKAPAHYLLPSSLYRNFPGNRI